MKKLTQYAKKAIPLILTGLPLVAHASGYGDSSGDFMLVQVLQKLIDLLTSSIAGLVFTAAMIGIGYSWLILGKLEKHKAINWLVAGSVIYGASWLAKTFGFV